MEGSVPSAPDATIQTQRPKSIEVSLTAIAIPGANLRGPYEGGAAEEFSIGQIGAGHEGYQKSATVTTHGSGRSRDSHTGGQILVEHARGASPTSRSSSIGTSTSSRTT